MCLILTFAHDVVLLHFNGKLCNSLSSSELLCGILHFLNTQAKRLNTTRLTVLIKEEVDNETVTTSRSTFYGVGGWNFVMSDAATKREL